MKSLEILDFYLKVAEEMEEDKFKNVIKNGLNQIKEDLEVLEIIWEKRISMEYLWFLYDYYKDFTNGINYMLQKINEHQDETRKLTVEEMIKLKQWLEENDE